MSALIWSTFADKEAARAAAKVLVEERLAVCGNIIGAVESLYLWRGEVASGEECGLLLKTDAKLLDQAVQRLEAVHPYDEPAIMGWHADRTGAATGRWLAAEIDAGNAAGGAPDEC